jgi:hypothetical protein
MTTTQTLLRSAALALLAGGLVAQAATVTGTVTNKTTNKPSAGDAVVLVDVQSGMGEVAHTTTDGNGRYTLNEPGSGPYLVRVAHQGATYFIGAPQGSAPGDIGVYDAAPKVDGIGVSADVIEFETGNGQLLVNERYFIHNNSNPARTQTGTHGFEIVLPADAVLDGGAATRPTSTMPTNVTPEPAGQKGHYTINVPIQPNQGEKETVFDLRYHLPYDGKKFTYSGRELLPAENVAVLLPKSMSFTAGAGLDFKPVQEDPGILTFIAKNTPANRELAFTISGQGSMPREDQSNQGAQGSADMGTGDNKPGGGIGAPLNTPDPLNKYKWWILGALALLLAAIAAFLLRKPAGASAALPAATFSVATSLPTSSNAAILQVLKDELFALESEKLSGTLSADEYAEVKAALETVLKRALKKS